jgi:DNA end-binding protein Ku
MARSIWNGTVSFGMVSIPVRLSTATSEKDIAFHMIHEVCGSRIKLQRFCPSCERAVEREEIVKGYEYAKGHHVIMGDEDFEKLPLPSKHVIEVTQFIKQDEIDPIYYDKTYYLEPEEAGKKPFALLIKALEEKGATAIAQIALRHAESLCCLRVADGKLVMETLFYPDEIRDAPEVKTDIEVGEKELAMAGSLIDMLSEPFDPEKYNDNYREALMEVIQAKLEGGEVKAVPEAGEAGEVIDLMDALRKSVEAVRKEKKA